MTVTLKGVLLPTSWDPDGLPQALVLSTAGENDYMIVENHVFGGLLRYAGQFVELTGTLSENNSHPHLTVTTFTRLPHLLP